MTLNSSLRRLGCLVSLLCVSGFALLCAACTGAGTPAGPADEHVGTAASQLDDDQCAFFDVDGHVQICHHTSSTSHPFTIMKTSVQGCINGHAGHALDYIAVGDPTCQGGGCLPETAPCDATLPCCDGLSCQDGTCVDLCAGVVCTPIDACHTAGVCNPATGQCGSGARIGDTTTDLAHHWTFDEPSGSTAIDSTGASNGTLGSSAVRWPSFDGSGAIAFNPTAECDSQADVDFGNTPGAFGTADFTVSLWMATNFSGGGQGDLIGNRVNGSHGNFFSGRLAANGLMNTSLDDNGSNFAAVSSSTVINDGAWHNIVYTRTGTTLSVYLDGNLDGSATSLAPTNILGSHPFKLGRSLPCLSGFRSIPALFDDVRTYNRPLGACDARALVEDGGHVGTPATFP